MVSEKDWQEVLDHTEADVCQDEFPGVAAKAFQVYNSSGLFLWFQLESGDVQVKNLDRELDAVAKKFEIPRKTAEIQLSLVLDAMQRDYAYDRCYQFDGSFDVEVSYDLTLRDKCEFLVEQLRNSILFERSDYSLLLNTIGVFNKIKTITSSDVDDFIISSLVEVQGEITREHVVTITMDEIAADFALFGSVENVPKNVTVGSILEDMQAFDEEDW